MGRNFVFIVFSKFVSSVFHTKLGTTESHRNGSSDNLLKPFQSLFERHLRIPKKKFAVARKNDLKMLIFLFSTVSKFTYFTMTKIPTYVLFFRSDLFITPRR